MEQPAHRPTGRTLYDPSYEHDACGVGFVARTSGLADHDVLVKALQSVANVTHRGAVDADQKTGDGAGVLTQLPYRLLQREIERLGLHVDDSRDLAVGMLFLPERDEDARAFCTQLVERNVRGHGIDLVGWREVPIDLTALGDKATETRPRIVQALLGRPTAQEDDQYERTLYLARREIEREAEEAGLDDRFYIASFSSRTLVYKGLMISPQLPAFYVDLRDPDYETALALFHQRYSTNTLPNWFLAQPFRMLAHNGEINTLRGNRNWMRAREGRLESPLWGERLDNLLPLIWERGSDSASLDQALELLEQSGRDVLHSMSMLVPSAWENLTDLPAAIRGFYEYHALLTEPWDGPAALSFSDGRVVGAVLDRNGLRPSRYKIGHDGLVVAASEVGVFELDDRDVKEKGRLGPGQMLAVDTVNHQVLKDEDIKRVLADRQPYADWVADRRVLLPSAAVPAPDHRSPSPNNHASNGHRPATERPDSLEQLQRAFGYTAEDVKFVLRPMGLEGQDPVFSMGDDTPPAILATRSRLLYSFFKQQFAQVTNPPIDPLRERLVMSLRTELGPRGSLLCETPEHAELLFLDSPIIGVDQLTELRSLDHPKLRSATISALFAADAESGGLRAALERICREAEAAVDDGASLLVISDRGADARRAPVPMLMAVGAVHHHLIRAGKRMRADLIAEAGDAWDVHHFACLIGYGAGAVCPWLALDTLADHLERDLENRLGLAQRRREPLEQLEAEQAALPTAIAKAREKFIAAAEKGLLKILSKMGISTISSYRGAQIFEALGLADDVVESCFAKTPSRIAGIGFGEIGADVLARHAAAFGSGSTSGLPDYGFIRFRREGEYHGFNPTVVRALQKTALGGDRLAYRAYARLLEERPPATLRDLLHIRETGRSVPLDEVEPADAIRRRFISTAMSLGALSPEAHRTLAIAMNRIGARSNSGEGGEDPQNYAPLPNGDVAHNRIKQVASGRFGVTAQYLAMADELEIKMAQGSKPGEGGQLPGHKVTEMIARLRFAVPGVQLISPPPHHDIYSIEDLAQLIYDLKQANPRARVGVKLVAEAGVGTIAAGVAKAYADYVLISGHDGGTGASPLSSIKNAGCPWELGLAETQQTLVRNDLRGRIIVRTDGGLKTGKDVVIAAMLGAEEFGFGTAAVVALGCDMARACHLNTCPTGIATQREDKRARFTGTPEQVIHFFTHLAEDVREILASIGCRSLDEVVGRSDLLERRESPSDSRAALVDLSRVLEPADPSWTRPRLHTQRRNTRPSDASLDPQIVRDAQDALEHGRQIRASYRVLNSDRAIGTRLSGEIARRFGSKGLPDGTIELRFSGTAGQSFGAWACRGMRLYLEGEANDYVGKGLCGAEIVVTPPQTAGFASHENVIVGNTVLYGATAGRLYVSGQAGERFAVRNSGAVAIVEGVGDHACEYMTGGVVVVLGQTGRNFAAGMSNGVAYVLDEANRFPSRLNTEMARVERVMRAEDLELVYTLVREHFERTGSQRAEQILDAWDYYRGSFWKVIATETALREPSPAPSEQPGARSAARA